jgi:hypothetical protein
MSSNFVAFLEYMNLMYVSGPVEHIGTVGICPNKLLQKSGLLILAPFFLLQKSGFCYHLFFRKVCFCSIVMILKVTSPNQISDRSAKSLIMFSYLLLLNMTLKNWIFIDNLRYHE